MSQIQTVQTSRSSHRSESWELVPSPTNQTFTSFFSEGSLVDVPHQAESDSPKSPIMMNSPILLNEVFLLKKRIFQLTHELHSSQEQVRFLELRLKEGIENDDVTLVTKLAVKLVAGSLLLSLLRRRFSSTSQLLIGLLGVMGMTQLL